MNTISSRLVYENAKTLFQAAGVDVSQAKLTQSTLRSERAIVTSTNQYQFSWLQQDGVAQNNTEIKLNQTYAALIYELGFFLGNAASATDAAFSLYSYPAPALGSDASALQAFYNGVINLKINGQDVLVNTDMFRFLNVPRTQAAASPPPIDEIHGNDVFVPIEPNIIIYGTWKVDFSVVLPAAVTAVPSGNPRAVFIARVLLAQNASLIR